MEPRPVIARPERTHHTVLWQLLPLDVARPTPGEHSAVTLKAFPVAGFLVAVQRKIAKRQSKLLKQCRHLALQHQHW